MQPHDNCQNDLIKSIIGLCWRPQVIDVVSMLALCNMEGLISRVQVDSDDRTTPSTKTRNLTGVYLSKLMMDCEASNPRPIDSAST